MKEVLTQEFISKDEYERKDSEINDKEEVVVRAPWEEQLTQLANRKVDRISIPRSPHLPKEKVINAFHNAFELMGGTARLTLWGDENPTEFYKLYAKLMPRQVEQETKHDGGVKVIHVLPRGKLDE